MVTIRRDDKVLVKPDNKRRVLLPKELVDKDSMFHIYTNDMGQIILDPQATIPASELWVFQNKNILASLDKSMAQSKKGQTINRGSFAKYVTNEA